MRLTILSSSQLGTWNILKKYNLDPKKFFLRAGLNPELVFKQGARYSIVEVHALWKLIDAEVEDRSFGLHAATCWHPSQFGLLGHTLLMSQCIRSALDRVVRFQSIVTDSDYGFYEEDNITNTVTFTLQDRKVVKRLPQEEDVIFGVLFSIFKTVLNRKITPLSVTYKNDKPECHLDYDVFFGTSVKFNSESTSFTLSLSEFDEKSSLIPSSFLLECDHTLFEYMKNSKDLSVSEKVAQCISKKMSTGNVSLNLVAKALNFSTRSLQRLLKDENETFLNVLNQTRNDTAKGLLKNKDIGLQEVTLLLGFADQAAFSNFFKKMNEFTPTQYRAKHINKSLVSNELVAFSRQKLTETLYHYKNHNQQLLQDQQELFKIALYDELTTLANKRQFNRTLRDEWSRCQREQLPLTLAIGDIDFFKQYNDTYGHHQGDVCLKEIALLWGDIYKRPFDLAARIGGEEFAVILPNTPPEDTLVSFQKFLRVLQERSITHETSHIASCVTMSIGVAGCVPHKGSSPDDLFILADRHLYSAKDKGRNQVFFS